MKIRSILFSLSSVTVIMILLMGCSDSEEGLRYLGSYKIDVQQEVGILDLYDEQGNHLGMGLDTLHHKDLIFDVTAVADTDSFLILGLYTEYPVKPTTITGYMAGDTLRLHRDQSDLIAKDVVVGYIYRSSDSIYVKYRWGQTNIWANSAPPLAGTVSGRGTL